LPQLRLPASTDLQVDGGFVFGRTPLEITKWAPPKTQKQRNVLWKLECAGNAFYRHWRGGRRLCFSALRRGVILERACFHKRVDGSGGERVPVGTREILRSAWKSLRSGWRPWVL